MQQSTSKGHSLAGHMQCQRDKHRVTHRTVAAESARLAVVTLPSATPRQVPSPQHKQQRCTHRDWCPIDIRNIHRVACRHDEGHLKINVNIASAFLLCRPPLVNDLPLVHGCVRVTTIFFRLQGTFVHHGAHPNKTSSWVPEVCLYIEMCQRARTGILKW